MFSDADDHARAFRLGGGPRLRDLDLLATFSGEDGAIMRATYGRSAADFADAIDHELRQEQRSRPHVFVRKLNASRRRVADRCRDDRGGSPRLISASEFASSHAAAEFAAAFGLTFEVSVTVNWMLCGIPVDAVPDETLDFTRCARDRLARSQLPTAFMFVHENGPSGLHTHFLFHIPVSHRSPFREWATGWADRRYGRKIPYALRVRSPLQERPQLHWRLFSYLMKGYDRDAVLVSARNTRDGMAIRLGDLIAWPWHDPGPIPYERIGICHNLGPKQRRSGAPREFAQPTTPFGSRFLEGMRDVRDLYAHDFYELVTGLPAVPAGPAEAEAGCDIDFDTLNL